MANSNANNPWRPVSESLESSGANTLEGRPESAAGSPCPEMNVSGRESGFKQGTEASAHLADQLAQVRLNPFTVCEVHWAGRQVYKCGEWFCKKGTWSTDFLSPRSQSAAAIPLPDELIERGQR